MAESEAESIATVLDLMLLRDAERVRERHCAADERRRCVWCSGHWPCAARQLADRAERVATGTSDPTTPLPLSLPVGPVDASDTPDGVADPAVADDVAVPTPFRATSVDDVACVEALHAVAVPTGLAAVPTVQIPAVPAVRIPAGLSGPRRIVTRRSVRARRDGALRVTTAQPTGGVGTALAVRAAAPSAVGAPQAGRGGWRWGFMGRRSA